MQYLAMNEELMTFSNMMEQQLDLRCEAKNLTRFRQNFAKEGIPVIFPHPVTELTTKQVLVESFHEGVPLSAFLESNPTVYDEDLSQVGIRAFLKMTLRHNFTHADLHPGNALITFFKPSRPHPTIIPAYERDNAISPPEMHRLLQSAHSIDEFRSTLTDLWKKGYKPAIIALDVGLVSELLPHNSRNLTDVFTAAVNGDGDTIANLLTSRCRNPSLVIDIPMVRAKMRHLVQDVTPRLGRGEKVLPLSQLHSADVVVRAAEMFRTHRIGMDGDWISLFVAAALIEGIGRKLDSDLDLFEVLADEIK
ncbi:hypothetical protein BC829DRAFT_491084 [Chytridium lagenaria]|nr:hypothetical protein BC829DRAFT_491084 [Chytridium lagenaria]